jgi:hypothetical protein
MQSHSHLSRVRLAMFLAAFLPTFAPAVFAAPATRPSTQPVEGANFVKQLLVSEVNWTQPNYVLWDPNVAQSFVRLQPQTVKAAYLGVGVASPDAILRAQLKLPDGAGLVVNFVDEAGPSKESVKLHDVLQKLDDQILVNADQLVTLVRMRKPGDTAKMTVIREAQPVTVEVKLGQKDLPPLQSYLGNNKGDATVKAAPAPAPGLVEAMYVQDLGDWLRAGEVLAQPQVVARGLTTGPVTFDDSEHVLQIRLQGGLGTLTVIDKKTGSKLFEGPIGTEEQWKAVPEEVRKKLQAVSGSLNQFLTPNANFATFAGWSNALWNNATPRVLPTEPANPPTRPAGGK